MNIATFSQAFADHWVLFSMLGVALVLGLWSALASRAAKKNGSGAKPDSVWLVLLALLLLLCFWGKSGKGRR
jgi:hypothetical protein